MSVPFRRPVWRLTERLRRTPQAVLKEILAAVSAREPSLSVDERAEITSR